jgi:hypothetical protein
MGQLTYEGQGGNEPFKEWNWANLQEQLRREKDDEGYAVQIRYLAEYHVCCKYLIEDGDMNACSPLDDDDK